MAAHDRLMKVPTTGLTILDILTDGDQDRKSHLIRELLEVCTKKISNNCTDLKILETFRMILCYEYQTLINSEIRWSPFKVNSSKIDVNTFFLRDIDSFENSQEFAFLYDIATLRLAFNCNEKALISLFSEFYARFYESQKENSRIEEKALHLCLRALECIADSYNLHSRLHKQGKEVEELPDSILTIIELWMKQEMIVEWQSLAKLLPKLVSIFGAQNVLTPLWNKVLDDRNELDRILDTLCVIADLCFPSKENLMQKVHLEYCLSPQFWLVLCRSIDSSIYQERKKGLYLIKRALDFISCNESQIRIDVDLAKVEMVPFIRTDPKENKTDLLIKQFFLLLESSEEKQKHLVLPALTYLPDLVKAYTVQKCQGYNFHKMWLQCVFKRFLSHDNIAIKKLALQEIFKADLEIYDGSLIFFLANCLNNILLYDFDYTEETLPKTVLQLAEFFWRSEQAEVLLINNFVQAISKINWCPVTIYWVLKALEITADRGNIVHNVWTPEELRSVTKLVTLNLSNHYSRLHGDSESLIQAAFCKYIAPNSHWPDIELVANTINSMTAVRLDSVYDHVAEMIKASDAQSYVSEQCKTLWPAQSSNSFGAKIFLFVGSGLILSEKNCLAKESLHDLFQTLKDVHRRLYTDKAAVLRVLQLASYLMESIKLLRFKNRTRVKRLLLDHLETLFLIVESFIEKTTIPEYEHTRLTKALIEHDYRKGIDNHKSFCDQCIDIVFNPNKLGKYHWLFALKTINVYREYYEHFYHLESISSTKMRSLIMYFKEEILNDRSGDATRANDEFDRKIVNDCSHNVALFMCNYLKSPRSDASIEKWFWLQDLQLLIETGPEENIIAVADTISSLLHCKHRELEIEDINVIISIIRLACRQVFQLKKTKVFFDAIENLTKLTINSEFLKLGGVAKEIAIEWVDQLMMEGKRVPLLKQSFVKFIRWTEEQDAVLFLQPFLNCLLHGEILRNDQKIERAAAYYVESASTLTEIDVRIRGEAVLALLHFLNIKKGSESRFREKMLQEILLVLKKHRNKRYFDNSHVHRLKHRAMQALLVLAHFLNDEEGLNFYHEMCDLLIAESDQPSVRLMQEWLLVRIYTNSLMDESVWKLFETAIEKRPGSIVSIASVVFHISRVLEDKEDEIKINFICKGISHLLPFCMSQQFNVRLYSQVILVKLYEMLPADRCDQFKNMVEGVRESLRHGNLIKNSPKIMDDFYFTEFHANAEYNLEIIYEELPRLTGVHSDEWIRASEFMEWSRIGDDFPMACSRKLKSMKSTKPASRSAGGELGNEELDTTSEGGLSDIQKKIIPWKSMTPFTDELSEVSKAALERKSKLDNDAGIIVVASLIDRPPNLGGLARTCEIFGAKELVIGSLKYAEDREFQTLSVSAEKWITITEVKAHLLKNYLLEQRSKGWKLVGAEQTANSTNLLEMEFDKKTILLLGNEKDGIPANLIPILDTCVEIPQHGVIRSLNVHVTGAICIWQYARQHVLA